MHWGKWGLFLTITSLALSGCVVGTEQLSGEYTSCDEVRSQFPSGVATEGSDLSEFIVKPVTDATGYARAINLDIDSDGIACEFENPPKAQGQATPGKPVNNSTFFNFRIVDGSLERKGNRGDWHSFDFETNGLSEIRRSAFSNMRSTASYASPNVNWLIAESVPSGMREAYQFQVEQTLVRLPFKQDSSPIDLVIYTEKDLGFAKRYWSQFFHSTETLTRRENDLAGYAEAGGVNWSVGGSSDVRQPLNQSAPIVGVDFYMSSEHTPELHLLPDHVPHELFHVWQWQTVGIPEKIASQERYDIADYIPCHAMEGAATTVGNALLMPQLGWYSDNADVIVRRIANQSGITSISRDDAMALLIKGESWDACNEAYAIGMLAHEWLIGNYGFENFLEIYRLAGERVPYAEAIQSLYGFSLEQFYSKVSDYIAEQYNRAMEKNY